MNHYELAIIGGGPAGYTAAEKAGKSKIKTILFEKSKLGGVCLNEGCIPTKTLLYSAKLLDQSKSASKYALEMEAGTVNMKRLGARKNKVVRKLVLGVKAKVVNAGVTIIEGEAQVVNNTTISCNGELFSFDKLIIATGSSTFIPPIKGVEKVDFWTHADALDTKEVPQSLVVIGGGVIGLEFASFYNSLGTSVSVIEMMDEILPTFDRETVAYLREEYTKKGVDFMLSTQVKELHKKADTIEIVVKQGDTERTILAEKVLLSVGRRPNLKGTGLENLTLSKNEKGGYIVDEKLRTSDPNIFICGDANGKSLLAHTAIREAEVVINNMNNVEDSMNYDAISSITYTNPEIAGVGKTEEELIKQGISYEKRVIPMTYSGRFVAENEGVNGLCKLLFDKDSQKILGVHLVGNPASELITLSAMAITWNTTVSEWNKLVFPHPTVGEVFKDLL